MNKTYRQFETKRLHLKPTDIDDAEFVLRIMNSPKWLKYIGDRKVRTLKDAKTYINNKMTPLLEKRGFSNYTMITKSDDVKIGSCGLYDREDIDGIDIGFALLPEHEGLGYAYEAASKILESAKEIFHLKKLSAITTPENIASQNLLKNIGLEFVNLIEVHDERLMIFEIKF